MCLCEYINSVKLEIFFDAHHVEIDHSIKDIWSDLYLSRVKSIMGRAGVIANNLAIHKVDSNSTFHIPRRSG